MTAAMPLYAQLAPLIDPSLTDLGQQARAQGFVESLRRLSETAGMPQKLRDVGVTASDLDGLAADAMLQERLLRNNPRPIEQDDARQLYEAAL